MLGTTKQCGQCHKIKNLSEYCNHPRGLYKKQSKCKKCSNENTKKLFRTKDGLCTRIYASQLSSSRRRGHVKPSYSVDDLRAWMQSQNNFNSLYDNWVDSGYSKMITPSCDRLDDFMPYSLNNIRLVTWGDNSDKGHMDRANGRGTTGLQCRANIST